VEASLETSLDGEETVVGNPVSVRLRDPIKHTGTVVAANDAPMHGHVTRAEHRGDTFLLRLSFESLDFDGGHSDAMAPHSKFRGEKRKTP